MDEARSDRPRWQAVLIAGPTASGKSALALELAERWGGVVVNADSMQVYDGLRILTARPSDADTARAEHRLYGHVDPSRAYSVGEYVRDAANLLARLARDGAIPIFCGGTGLYFKALLGSLDAMPAVPQDIRDAWRARLAQEGAPSLHRLLLERDPATGRRLAENDGQRIVRALEIEESSGRPLSSYHKGKGKAVLDGARCLKLVIDPERAWLRQVIADRFEAMVDAGAVEEVAALRTRPSAWAAPVSRAIGVAELGSVLDGHLGMIDAVQRAVTRSRQYAKRQETWFRGQFGRDWRRIDVVGGSRPGGI